MILSQYISICKAFSLLMHPLIEIVIHEMKSGNIIYIQGSLSNRKVGDKSLLSQKDLKDIEKITYTKINFDGRLIKSISIILENRWLLCINCDVSIFNKMQDLSQFILQNTAIRPKSLFINDWQERLHTTIHSYLQQSNLSFDHLNKIDKKALINHLFVLGAFNERKASDYIAKLLNLGRATIFKYLKELKNQ